MKELKIISPKHGGKTVLIDDEDFDFVNQWKWSIQKVHKANRFYAIRSGGIQMHREILERHGKLNGLHVDHSDGDGLNNQKNNIRSATRSQNGINRSGWSKSKFKGVTIDDNKIGYLYYRSRIQVNKKMLNLGTFKTDREAAIAYNTAALQHFGAFAKLNSI